MGKLKSLPYFGGKSGKVGSWVASMLPESDVYVEPFAGMLGVLLKRKPSKVEIVNDLNSEVYNWWKQLRDNHEALCELLSRTPYSEQLFNEHKHANWDEQTDLWRAWAFTIIVWQSYASKSNRNEANFGRFYSGGGPVAAENIAARLAETASRIGNIQLFNTDAIKLLKRLADRPDATIYCDPPYYSASIKEYTDSIADVDSFKDVLTQMKGKVAISGYPGEYDDLGWETHTLERKCRVASKSVNVQETVWTNYILDSNLQTQLGG